MAMSPDERYETDLEFRKLVDSVTDMIIRCEYSPSELRIAVILAHIRYETFHSRPTYLLEGNTITRTDSYHGKEERKPGKIERIPGTWKHRETCRTVENAEAWDGIVFVNDHTWAWHGNLDYFYAEFDRICEGKDHGKG